MKTRRFIPRTFFLLIAFTFVQSLTQGLWLDSSVQADEQQDLFFEELKKKYEAEKSLEDYKRSPTIEAFGTCKSEKVVPFLNEILEKESNPYIHATVGKALGNIGTEDAVKTLVTKLVLMFHKDLLNFPYIEKALMSPMEKKAEDFLLKKGLSSKIRKSPNAYRAVIRAIGNLKSTKRFTLLASELRKARDPEVQLAVLNVYKEFKPKNAARDASKFIKSRDQEVQASALEVLLVTEAKTRTYQKYYVALLRSPYWKTRALSVDCLDMVIHKDRLKLLVPMLKDKNQTVQLAVIAALVNVGTKDVIMPLINAVDSSKGRVQDDVLDALIRLTGKDMGYSSANWESWWLQYKDKVEVRKLTQEEFADAKVHSKAKKASGTLLYHGLRVLSDKCAFIIDTSESMKEVYDFKDDSSSKKGGKKGGTVVRDPRKKSSNSGGKSQKITVAKNELIKVLKSLKNGVLINVIRFDTFITPWRPKLQELTGGLRDDVNKFVQAAQPNGLTNVFDALDKAFKDERLDTIYLLSDGAPTHGAYKKTADILREIDKMNRIRRVKINTIGFNLKPHEKELLKRLAEATGGVFISK